jgi:PIN domain nuclease of toxin-antitoxin system
LIHLDTHVAVWLAIRKPETLSSDARRVLERSRRLVISPFVLLEADRLAELGRRPIPPAAMLLSLLNETWPLEISQTTASAIVDHATTFAWTRDPFDRLIVANAMADGARLVTADEKIRANFKDAVW